MRKKRLTRTCVWNRSINHITTGIANHPRTQRGSCGLEKGPGGPVARVQRATEDVREGAIERADGRGERVMVSSGIKHQSRRANRREQREGSSEQMGWASEGRHVAMAYEPRCTPAVAGWAGSRGGRTLVAVGSRTAS